MDNALLGKRIREERQKLNLTQEKLAEDVGLSPAYIGQVERGERSLTLNRLVSIVNRLGVTIDYLMSDFVPADNTTAGKLVLQLFHARSENDCMLAVSMVKLMFSYLDEKH